MIKSDAQRERTAAQLAGFRQALAKVDQETTSKRAAAVRGSYEGMIRQLEDELREYDAIKSGELALPDVERLDQIAPFIAKMRIAKGVSQTELSRRLGVSKQVGKKTVVKTMHVATAKFSVHVGKTGMLTAKLNAAGFKLLKTARRMRVKATITSHDASGAKGVTAGLATMQAPAKTPWAKKPVAKKEVAQKK